MEVTKETIDKVFDSITDKQIEEFIEAEYNKDKCYPETCGGECQGMGWCDVAQQFMNSWEEDEWQLELS